MINFNQFKQLTERTLKEMDAYSDRAVKAIMMIVAHESTIEGKTYLRQVKGPALGVIQMEPDTHQSVWEHCDTIDKRSFKAGIDMNLASLEYDLRYCIFMARCKLIMIKEPFPEEDIQLSRYIKRYYNTEKGKANYNDYINAYIRWMDA